MITGTNGAPTRVPVEFTRLFGSAVHPFTPGRVLLPPTPAGADRWNVVVRAADLDPMAHVNNATYIDYLEESLAAAGHGRSLADLPRRFRLEYVAPAGPGAPLSAATWSQGDGFGHRLLAAAGTELLRATMDGRTANEDFREAVAARLGAHAPGKDAGAG